MSLHLDESFIDKVRESNDIVDVISKYVDLKKAGENYKGLCPFHNEKTPSFVVNSNKQIYKCFGCGEGGNVISFLMKKLNIGFIDAVKILCENAHIQFPKDNIDSEKYNIEKEKKQKMYDIHIHIARYYYKNMANNLDRCQSYLKQRRISADIIKQFGIGYAKDSDSIVEILYNKGYKKEELLETNLFREKNGRVYCIFFSRIIFPIFDRRNRIIAFGGRVTGDGMPKYLNSPESLIFKKKENLYGLNLVAKFNSQRIILVEGYMDVISLYQNKIQGAVASLGTSLTNEQADIIKRQGKKVFICYDSDSAGVKATIRAIEIFKNASVRPFVIKLGKYKDPDEFFKENKTEDFMKKIQNAVSALTFVVDSIKERYNLQIFSQKSEFINQACKVIRNDSDPVEKEYQTKRLSDLTGTSIKAIGTKIYGKYFSARQFLDKNEEKTTEKDIRQFTQTNIPKLAYNNKIKENELKDLIKDQPSMIVFIKDVIDVEDLIDEELKKYYTSFKDYSEEHAASQEIIDKVKKLAIAIKIDKLQEEVDLIIKLQKDQKDINEANRLFKKQVELIKLRDSLKDKLKGMI